MKSRISVSLRQTQVVSQEQIAKECYASWHDRVSIKELQNRGRDRVMRLVKTNFASNATPSIPSVAAVVILQFEDIGVNVSKACQHHDIENKGLRCIVSASSRRFDSRETRTASRRATLRCMTTQAHRWTS